MPVSASAGQCVPVLTSGRATVSKAAGLTIYSGTLLEASPTAAGSVSTHAAIGAAAPGIGTCVSGAAAGDATVQADLQIIPAL